MDTPDLVVKKMVFLYLTSYAAKNSDLAILCINTLLTDCRNEDPLIRGLALRHLCSLKLATIAEYIQEPLLNSLRDNSPYVRKTGVIGVLKLHDLDPDIVRDSDLIDQLYNMIRDQDCSGYYPGMYGYLDVSAIAEGECTCRARRSSSVQSGGVVDYSL